MWSSISDAAFYVLTLGPLWIIGLLFNGVLISECWNWFVVPITHFRAISMVEGIGLSVFAATFRTINTDALKPDPNKPPLGVATALLGVYAFSIVGPLTFLALAWAWHTFVLT